MGDRHSAWEAATAGTYGDVRVPRAVAVTFLVVALIVALVPFMGMLWAPTQTTTENRELADVPALFDESGAFNANILSDLGAYFDDHFAYRNEAVTANARLRALLGTSATDQVVLGGGGWLFYGGTLPDYLGQSELSDRCLANIAHNLKLAQGYVESQGATFAFTLAPNKNSLDSTEMPYYYLKAPNASNASRLVPLLEEAAVNYVDLFSLFEGQMKQGSALRYLKGDSHWDNVWALLGANQVLERLGRERLPLDAADAEAREDFRGDLASMLYPASDDLETNYYFAGYNDLDGTTGDNWSYVEGSDVTDSWIRAAARLDGDAGNAADGVEHGDEADGSDAAGQHRQSGGSLLMFRDSFGNALVPYLSSTFANSAFSKLIPYNLAGIAQVQADAVVIERAERHLSYLATNPPLMPSPTVTFASGAPQDAREVSCSVERTADGPYWVISGEVSEPLAPSQRLYVSVQTADERLVWFDPFWTSSASDAGEVVSDSGFSVLASASLGDLSNAAVRVYIR